MRKLRAAIWTALLGLCVLAAANTYAREDDEIDSFDLTGTFPKASHATRIKALQVRISPFLGTLELQSQRTPLGSGTTSSVEFGGQQSGARLELEWWFQNSKNQRLWGLLTDTQLIYVGEFADFVGPAIYYLSSSVSLGYRLVGSGAAMPLTPELTLFAGPSYELFPSLLPSASFTSYALKTPQTLGAKLGSRLRISLFWNRLAAEVQGYMILPGLSVNANQAGTLVPSETRSYGVNLVADFRIPRTELTLGGGFFYSLLNLKAADPVLLDTVHTRMVGRSWLGTLRWSF